MVFGDNDFVDCGGMNYVGKELECYISECRTLVVVDDIIEIGLVSCRCY